MVEGAIKRATHEEIVTARRKMKPGKAAALSKVNMEILTASGETGLKVMMELCQHVLDERINTLFNINCEGSGCPFFQARG